MKRHAATPALLLTLAAGLLIAGCRDTTGPPGADELLAGFDAVAFRDAIHARSDAAQASAGASRVFWRALQSIGVEFGIGIASAAGPAAVSTAGTIPSTHYGRTFVYDLENREWLADDTRTGAPSDGIRVVWYRVASNGGIAAPLAVRGHIDLRDLPDTQGARLGVTVTSDSIGMVVADYVMDLDETRTEAEWNANLTAEGLLANPSRSLAVDLEFIGFLDFDSRDDAYEYRFAIEEPGFRYQYLITDVHDGDTETISEDMDIRVTVDGVTVRLELAGQRVGEGPYTFEAVLLIDDVTVATIDMGPLGPRFAHPDGGEPEPVDREKLDTMFWAILSAAGLINLFFG